MNVHWAAVESIFGVSTGASTTSARWWWRWTLWLADRPRLHSLYRDLVMVPLFLDRDRLSIRERARPTRMGLGARTRVSLRPSCEDCCRRCRGEQHESPDHRWSGLHRKHRGVEVRRRRDRCRDPRQPADRPVPNSPIDSRSTAATLRTRNYSTRYSPTIPISVPQFIVLP